MTSPLGPVPRTRAELLSRWAQLVPEHPELGSGLLRRWCEPHRDYHGPIHLAHGLAVLDHLEAGPVEYLAWWYHDAVHTNTTPDDELASARLAADELAGVVPDHDIAEVVRLVELTINHSPAPDDLAGQRLCDADLAMIALDGDAYRDQVQRLRNERDRLDAAAWDRLRISFTGRMLNRGTLFHSPWAQHHLSAAARRNLSHERDQLLSGTATPTSPRSPQPWLQNDSETEA